MVSKAALLALQPFSKYLVSPCVPGTVLGFGNAEISKADPIPNLAEPFRPPGHPARNLGDALSPHIPSIMISHTFHLPPSPGYSQSRLNFCTAPALVSLPCSRGIFLKHTSLPSLKPISAGQLPENQILAP